jgi:hypothetical protein
MPQEASPLSVATLDNLRLSVVPSGSNALSVAILNGATSKLITYSLQPDGYAFPITETEIADDRLTLAVSGSKRGRTKLGPVVLKYVYGSAADVAKALLVNGYAGQLISRDSLPNATDYAVAQKVDRYTFVAGLQRKVYSGDIQVIEQTLYIDAGSYTADLTLVA